MIIVTHLFLHKGDMNMKNKSVIALMLAFTMSFTSVCPALAAENTAVESEETTESESEEVSEENAVPVEETVHEEQNVSGADEGGTDASSENLTEPIETTDATDETADAVEETADDTEETTDVVVAEGTTEEYSKKAGEAAAEPVFAPITITVEGQSAVPESNGDESPEDLFEQYMSVEFGISGRSSMRKAKKITGTRLEGNDRAVYQIVASELPAIAAGKRESTEFILTLEDFGVEKAEWTAEELGVSSIVVEDEQGNVSFAQDAYDAANAKISFKLQNVLTALLADYPYELYWFDKTVGAEVPEYSLGGAGVNGEWTIVLPESISLCFSVAGDFSAGEYTVNTDIGMSVQDAVENANAIIELHSGDSDEGKLQCYKDAICDLVSYNDEAASANYDLGYGNPWQLLWVFDNDDQTKVVCEGYSKAFKYLCDRSSFDGDITCILVTGEMAGGTGAGPHMWNIVKMGDGQNYLVDVTNCDEGTSGSPNQLFLVRTDDLHISDGIETGYTFLLSSGPINYSYDKNTLSYYRQDEISLGEVQHVHTLARTEAKDATCTEAGNTEYWTCSECKKLFSDSEGKTEITAEDTVVAAKGHELTKTEAKDATCTEAGKIGRASCRERV